MRFLVIDDKKSDVDTLQGYLQKSFPMATIHCCNRFYTGAQCLQYDEYDAVFIDLNLPDNWGISTVKELKPYAKNVPIYVTTSIAHWVTVKEAIKAGAAAVEEKRNLSTDTILNMVGQMTLVG